MRTYGRIALWLPSSAPDPSHGGASAQTWPGVARPNRLQPTSSWRAALAAPAAHPVPSCSQMLGRRRVCCGRRCRCPWRSSRVPPSRRRRRPRAVAASRSRRRLQRWTRRARSATASTPTRPWGRRPAVPATGGNKAMRQRAGHRSHDRCPSSCPSSRAIELRPKVRRSARTQGTLCAPSGRTRPLRCSICSLVAMRGARRVAPRRSEQRATGASGASDDVREVSVWHASPCAPPRSCCVVRPRSLARLVVSRRTAEDPLSGGGQGGLGGGPVCLCAFLNTHLSAGLRKRVVATLHVCRVACRPRRWGTGPRPPGAIATRAPRSAGARCPAACARPDNAPLTRQYYATGMTPNTAQTS
jgi:hypothetical protein